jgi:hypothetical protein
LIISLLNGGLGNQLFQYAAGKSLALFNSTDHRIDISRYLGDGVKSQTPRNLDILDFSITSPVASPAELSVINPTASLLKNFADKLVNKIRGSYHLDWHPELFSAGSNLYLKGYFQCERYFASCVDQIRAEFTLQSEYLGQISPICKEIKSAPASISVHVRRGDYVQSGRMKKIYDVCTDDYYLRAILAARKSYPDAVFYIFSDDIGYSKNLFSLVDGVHFLSSRCLPDGTLLRPSQELFLMSQCNHNIIANSSFSWWGAYLNQNPNKLVIAPSVWNRSSRLQQPNILPESWLQIEV